METQRNLTSAEYSQTPHIGVAGEICCGIRTILHQTRSLVTGTSLMPAQSYARLQNETERFALWADSFAATSGRLDDILRNSKELRTVVMTLLYDMGKVICDGFTESTLLIPPGHLLLDELKDLHLILEKLPHSLGLVSEVAVEVLSDDDEIPPNLDETLEDLEFYIDSLMDLSPALDNPLTDLDLDDSLTLPIETFDVGSLAAQVFCRKIHDRFPSLDKRLVERLGQSNADRLLMLKSLEKASISEDDGGEPLFSVSGPSRSGTRTSSQPSSVFDKQHLLSPIPEDAQSLTTLVSLVSFKSSLSDASKGRPMVPKFPETRSEAGLAQCYVCQRWLPGTTSRTAWKKHIFGDLKPYICTQKTCGCQRQLWESSLAWVKHETSHEPQNLESLSCPFCAARPKSSNINNHYKHVAEHLREISLAALPVTTDDNNEDASTDENGSLSSVDLSEDSLDHEHSALDADAAPIPQKLDADLPSENRQEFASGRQSFSWKRTHSPVSMGLRRTDKLTEETGRRSSFLPPPPVNWVKVVVSAYNLEWSDLRNWLLNIFKDHHKDNFFDKQALYDDCFYFFAPRDLTEAEYLEIDGLRAREDHTCASYRPRTPDRSQPQRDDSPPF